MSWSAACSPNALRRAAATSDAAAARLILIDVIDDHVATFHRRHGFIGLPECLSGSIARSPRSAGRVTEPNETGKSCPPSGIRCFLMAAYLLILGNREGLRWVLTNRRMAFSRRSPSAQDIVVGDELLLYVTRGCFRNPGRDRGMVVGSGLVASPVVAPKYPVEVAGRSLNLVCDIDLRSLAPRGKGVVMAELVERLSVFPDAAAWSAWLRRPFLRLPDNDARILATRVAPLAGDPAVTSSTYF